MYDRYECFDFVCLKMPDKMPANLRATTSFEVRGFFDQLLNVVLAEIPLTEAIELLDR